MCPLCGRCLHAGSARQTGKGADRRPLFIPPRPGAARNPVQNGTPQAPPNSSLANGSGLKQIGVLKPGAHPFARLAPTGWGAALTSYHLTAKDTHPAEWHDAIRLALSYSHTLLTHPAPRPACCGAPPGWRAVRRPAWQTTRRGRPARGARRLRPAPSAAGSAAR